MMPMVITAAEVFCPVGLDLVQAATSVAAGIARIEANALLDEDERRPSIAMGLVPEAVMHRLAATVRSQPAVTAHTARLLRLLSPCLENLAAHGHGLAEMPLLLGAPSTCDRPHGGICDSFFDHLAVQSGVRFLTGHSRLFPSGRPAFFEALAEAVTWLEGGRFSHVLVGGVDSLMDPLDIARYQRERRLLGDDVMDGFTPGEGAALVVLSHPSAASAVPAPLARLSGIGLGAEEGHRYSDQPYRGEGLARTVSSLFSRVSGALPEVRTVFAGFNGESFNAKEWGVTLIRNRGRFAEDICVEHPAEYIGDARAGLAPVMAAVAAYGISRNLWKGPVLVWASADDALRGAALLSPAAP